MLPVILRLAEGSLAPKLDPNNCELPRARQYKYPKSLILIYLIDRVCTVICEFVCHLDLVERSIFYPRKV